MEKPNLNYIQQISAGDKDFELSMLTILKDEFPKELYLIKKSFKEENYRKLSFSIHKIKHKISMLGMEKSFDLASEIEQEIKNGNLEQYANLITILERINVYLNNK
ncbi:Hpt domain-containing protein [Polaribacter batillariae]|uniref:Hpt domain-containing protein n=1 Tax=Polaribacter batillariae TaxID=2808900 RepID=A0ABX7SZN0_9FLAO|nr:Hpt domain-containing protein [Polaribacter batillariae]QTD38745.1 Hpt domain-containing protein [Polaribacter batillariae]